MKQAHLKAKSYRPFSTYDHPQNGTLGGILNFSGNLPQVVENCPNGGKLGFGRTPGVGDSKKKVGFGTFRPLFGGLRAENRKLANQRDTPKFCP